MDSADEPLGGIMTDSSITPTVEDFDIDAWLGGARPVRRSIMLYARGDLIGRLEELVGLIEHASDDDRPDLEAEAEKIQAEFLASGQTFTIEGRSSEWVDTCRDEYSKRFGLKLGAKTGTTKDQTEYFLRMLAEQIVVPSGMTYEKLKRLAQISEPDVVKLMNVQATANTQVSESAGVVTRDFSQGRSGTTPR